MTKIRRTLDDGRKDQVVLHQVHALDHVRGTCSGHFENPPRRTALTCPICVRDLPFDQFTEEDAPPKGGQSSLGTATTVVLTCRTCNNTAGASYEKKAAHLRELEEREVPGVPSCVVHGHPRIRPLPSGLDVVIGEAPITMTDLKAAFILGFAVFGYTWALAGELSPIRKAIQTGRAPSPRHVWIGKVTHDDSDPAVLEVTDTQGCVVVRAGDGTAVVMPSPGHPEVPTVLGALRVRTYPWPPTRRQASFVDRSHLAGHLFHADFCRRQHWS